MLNKLIIKNIALIEEAEVDFNNGLNVLSGETGSGKSVFLDSLNFVLGAKADKSMIRRGEDSCIVKAVFDISSSEQVKKALSEEDIELDDTLIISRKFTLTGSSSVKVNGEPLSVSSLKKITRHLVDVHGQSEHFYLLKEANQLELIDKYAAGEISPVKSEISLNVKELKEVNKQLQSLGGDDSQRAIRLDILNYQINEIENADVKENELEELLELKNKLVNQEKIAEALSIVKQAFSNEGGAVDAVSTSKSAMSSISNISEEYSSIFARIDAIYDEVSDISDTVGDMLDGADFNEFDLNRVEERLSLIKNIYKKYGPDYEELQAFLSSAKEEKDKLENFDVLADKLLKQKNILCKKIYSLYINLSEKRKKAAEIFSTNVLSEIRELKMKNADFKVEFSPLPENSDCLSLNGLDNIEFLFSANLGEPLKPLSKIISGGEMSRFMLAIKAQTAKYNDVSTFVFDEIDAGISGETALLVGEKFIKLSKNVQIIAISHLPQIVTMGDNNLLIEKKELVDKTVTTITSISDDKLINEVIRLIGGEAGNNSAVNHAKSLLDNASKIKNKYSGI